MEIPPGEWTSWSAGVRHASASTKAKAALVLSEAIHLSVCLFGKLLVRLPNAAAAVT